MQDFTIKVSPDTFVRVQAENEKDARAIVLAEIAKREGSKVHDQVFFDYDTGIKNKTLRAELSTAEIFKDKDGKIVDEREHVLERLVGSNGFTRDSSGKLAITPEGQKRLELKPSVKNIVIDERAAGTAGDYADLTGYAGPVFGAIASLDPRLRLAKWLQPYALNSIRVARSLIAGAGTAAGKGVEEATEIARGTQLQNEQEIAKLLKDEFLLGAAAQGVGETLGGVFQAYFGKTATVGNQRDANLLTRGFDLKYVRPIDREIAKAKNIVDPNYKAPLKDVLKALKKKNIKPTLPKGVVSQAALGSSIRSRGQQIAEMVGGPAARESKSKANLLASIRGLFEDIGAKGASIEDFIDSSAAGQLAASELKIVRNNLDKNLLDVDLKIDKLLRTLVQEMNGAKNLPPVQRKAIEKDLQESLKTVYDAWRTSNNKMYNAAENAINKADLDPALRRANRAFSQKFKEALDQAELDHPTIKASGRPYTLLRELVKKSDEPTRTVGGRKVLDRVDAETAERAGGQQIDEFAGFQEGQFARETKNVFEDVEGGVEFLKQLRSIRYDLKAQQNTMIAEGKANTAAYSTLRSLTKDIDDYFTDLGKGNVLLDDAIKKIGRGKQATLTVDAKGNARSKRLGRAAITALSKANADYADNIGRFDSAILKRITDDVKFNEGQGNIDELFGLAVKENNGPELKMILDAVNPNQREKFRAYMQQDLMKRLFNESLTETKMLNPVKFSQNLKRYGSTLKVLFGNKYDTNMAILRDIQVLKPKLSKTDLNNFLKAVDERPGDFTITRQPKERTRIKGLGPNVEPELFPGEEGFEEYAKAYNKKLQASKRVETYTTEPQLAPANKILEEMKVKAQLLDQKDFLDKAKFMQAVENETPETIVKNIFRPNSAEEINLVKNELLSPEAFAAVQENALGQMISEAVSVGQLRSTARLTDIFKPGVLSSALESYGDDTLIAMFGKETLDGWKAITQSLDLQVTATKGGAAGGIVAGLIGANALDLALMPTIIGLKVFSNILANPTVVRLLSRTEPGPIMQVVDAFEKSLRFTLAQDFANVSEETERRAFEELQKVREEVESKDNSKEMNALKDQIQQIQSMTPQPPRITSASIPIPEVQPVTPRTSGVMSQSLVGTNPANMDIAQRLANLS